tara:strand:- start:24 stop:176 length:153 start_codon:yes stop_codon:yes gene_type:complete
MEFLIDLLGTEGFQIFSDCLWFALLMLIAIRKIKYRWRKWRENSTSKRSS